jgi:hypothetical protein
MCDTFVSVPFHPSEATPLANPLGKRVVFTVVHRSGDIRNRFRPYFAALLTSHVGFVRVKSPSSFDKLR